MRSIDPLRLLARLPRSYGGLRAAVQIAVVALLVAAGPAEIKAADRVVKIVALGDSLTTGLGLPAQEAFPARLQKALNDKGIKAEIVDAGVSGDTSSGGLSRLDWSVPQDADAVIVELGANDALRAVDPKVTREAVTAIVAKLRERKVEVLLCGMLAPRNLGADYAAAFDPIYPAIAKAHDVVFYPFFLDGIAADPKFTQSDGMHPNAAGVGKIVEGILPKVEELIARVRARG
jgi:acyl-CoA thioesterase-1